MYRPKDHTFIVLMAAIKELFLEFKSMNDGYLSQPNANAFFLLPSKLYKRRNEYFGEQARVDATAEKRHETKGKGPSEL